MRNTKLTVVINTFRSEDKIYQCLNSIGSNYRVIIIENSNNFVHEKIVTSEFSNVKIMCTGENLGYGKGNNFGIKYTQSEYVLILNPDVICDQDFFFNITYSK